jgi:hypothetical protein
MKVTSRGLFKYNPVGPIRLDRLRNTKDMECR